MDKERKENNFIMGIIGDCGSKKCTLASAIPHQEENLPEPVCVKPKYTLSSVFPSKEVQEMVLDEIDKENKRRVCERLGIDYGNSINEISWDYLIELDALNNKQQKQNLIGKLLEKVRGKGV